MTKYRKDDPISSVYASVSTRLYNYTIPIVLLCFGRKKNRHKRLHKCVSIPPKTSGLPAPDQIISLLHKEPIRSELKELNRILVL